MEKKPVFGGKKTKSCEFYNMNEEKPVTITEAIRIMFPYFVIISITWLLILIGWYIIGLPIGPGVFPVI